MLKPFHQTFPAPNQNAVVQRRPRIASAPVATCEILFNMPCEAEILKQVALFALLDDEEAAVLAEQVEMRKFAPRQRIYKIGDPAGQAYVMVSGKVRVSTVDEDQQELIIDEPAPGEFFGFASMIDETPHQTGAMALEETTCIEVDRHDITVLLQRKPMAGMDMLTVLGKQFHASQQLIRGRSNRSPKQSRPATRSAIDRRSTSG